MNRYRIFQNMESISYILLMQLSNVNNFLKSIHKQYDQFLLSSRKTLDSMHNEISKLDKTSSVTKSMLEFTKYYDGYLSRNKTIMTKFDKDVIEPIWLFSKHMMSKYQDTLSDFKNVRLVLSRL
jgi:hypothetical protein